jgi:hypothetical protein
LTTAICDFFHYCVTSIMSFEKAVYEIVYFSKPDDGTVVGFELKEILPFTVMHRRTRLVQYVPLVVARERNISQYVPLSPERILTFRLPTYIQEEFGHIMEFLVRLSDFTLPDFALQEPGIISKRLLYDFNSHSHAHKLALADATKLIGWNARGLLSEEEILQYYQLHRDLLFERFVIELRNSILITLNDGLERAGRVAEFSGQLEIKGLPTLIDVDAAKAHLEAGDQSFEQILDPFGLL